MSRFGRWKIVIIFPAQAIQTAYFPSFGGLLARKQQKNGAAAHERGV